MVTECDFSDFGSEEDLKGFEYPAEGSYHLVVLDVDDLPEKVDGIKMQFQVLAGTVEGQAGRQFTETFFAPRAESKDGGKFAKKRMARLALATGLITPQALGQRVQIDWTEARGRQIVARIENYERKGNDGKTYKGAQIGGLDMHAVTSEEVAAVPKDAEALKLLGGDDGAGGGVPASGGGPKKPDPYADL